MKIELASAEKLIKENSANEKKLIESTSKKSPEKNSDDTNKLKNRPDHPLLFGGKNQEIKNEPSLKKQIPEKTQITPINTNKKPKELSLFNEAILLSTLTPQNEPQNNITIGGATI